MDDRACAQIRRLHCRLGGAEVNIEINCFPRDQSLSYSVK